MNAESGASIKIAAIGDQASLTLGASVDAAGIGQKPSAVVGFAGVGVASGALGWYPQSRSLELYDTSPASPNEPYDQGSRPYGNFKANTLRATGSVVSANGFSVDGNIVIDGDGNWAGSQVGNAGTIDGLTQPIHAIRPNTGTVSHLSRVANSSVRAWKLALLGSTGASR